MTIIKEETIDTSKDVQKKDENLETIMKDNSVYSKICAIYTRHLKDGNLCAIFEKDGCQFKSNWSNFCKILFHNNEGHKMDLETLYEYICEDEIVVNYTDGRGSIIKVSEYIVQGSTEVRGVIATIDNENETDFNNWLILHILKYSKIDLDGKPEVTSTVPYHEVVADFFNANIKNHVHDDKWEDIGRQYFINCVKYFTDRYLKIECVLPAFPCKSSNTEKVGDTLPDKGEEIAIRRLIDLCNSVTEFYPPGMKVFIVSDGHVFSDCIGVDDNTVAVYTEALHSLTQTILNQMNCKKDTIEFFGLNEIFYRNDTFNKFNAKWVEHVEVPHYTGSKICPDSDLSRQIMMKGFDTDTGTLAKQIHIRGHPRLSLYRGFSRFMMEDLALVPHFQNFSRKQFKKTISKIAFNMIKRNDAYSNLVEVMFPRHLRLSIHAHINSGPKFGIKLISSEECKIINNLKELMEPKFEDLLHIPTPWHNCIVAIIKETNGQEIHKYYLTKSKIITDAIESGKFVGHWEPSHLSSGKGGCFMIKENQ